MLSAGNVTGQARRALSVTTEHKHCPSKKHAVLKCDKTQKNEVRE